VSNGPKDTSRLGALFGQALLGQAAGAAASALPAQRTWLDTARWAAV
jgi:hypothetical protein